GHPAAGRGCLRAHARGSGGTPHRHPHRPGGRTVFPLAARTRQKAGDMELNNMNFNPFQATAPILEARRVCVTIGARRLLDHVDLAILPGRVTALLGPNGAGKSTLLTVMSGSQPATAGEVLLDGRPDISSGPAVCARQRALLAQDAQLPLASTVEEVAMTGRYPHARHRETARDVEIVHRSLCAA